MGLEQTFTDLGLKWIKFDDDARVLDCDRTLIESNTPITLQDIITTKNTAKLLAAENGELVSVSIKNEDSWAIVLKVTNQSSSIAIITQQQPASSEPLKTFIKKVSHDLKNPLGIAYANIEFLISLLDAEGALPKTKDVAKRAAEALTASISAVRNAEKSILNDSSK